MKKNLKIYQCMKSRKVLGIHCPLGLESLRIKDLKNFLWGQGKKKKKKKEQELTGAVTQKYAVKMHQNIPLYLPLSICQSH